jgi:c-di-GMP-binding flagellar brake protein YcgR
MNDTTDAQPTDAQPTDDAKTSMITELSAEELERYRVKTPYDIMGVLHTIEKSGSFITVYFNDNKDFLPTSLLGMPKDNKHLFLDVGGNDTMNRRAIEARDLMCVTSVDKVRIQFKLTSLSFARFAQRQAFTAPVPESVLRLQRRAYFRLIPPAFPSLKCSIPIVKADGNRQSIEAMVVDISLGGVALSFSGDELSVPIGAQVKNCCIDLPEIGRLQVTLQVRNVAEIQRRNGAVTVRWGCEFIDFQSAQETMVQKFIFNTERERKARESGFGR